MTPRPTPPRRAWTVVAAFASTVGAARTGAAEPAERAEEVPTWSASRVWLGLQLGVPGQGSGLPIRGEHVPGGLAARYALDAWRAGIEPAVTAVLGPTVAGVGLGGFVGLELRWTLLGGHLALTATPAVRTGYAGTLYYARRSHVFVGYEYLYSGPWTVAPRAAVGLATPIVRHRIELYLDGFVEEPLLPTPQTYFGADAGVRVRL